MTEKQDSHGEITNPLDKFIQIHDISEVTDSTAAIERKRFRGSFPETSFPPGVYDDLRAYLHFSGNHKDDEATKHAQSFENKMGFSVDALVERAIELENQANKK